MNNRVDINIPNLLEMVESNDRSINSLAKEYGISYATLNRRVRELQSIRDEEVALNARMIDDTPISKDCIRVVNVDDSSFVDIFLHENTTFNKSIYASSDDEAYEIDSYEIQIKRNDDKIQYRMNVKNKTFNKIKDLSVIKNRMVLKGDFAYIGTDEDNFLQVSIQRDIDFKKEVFFCFNDRAVNITEHFSKVREELIKFEDDIQEYEIFFIEVDDNVYNTLNQFRKSNPLIRNK